MLHNHSAQPPPGQGAIESQEQSRSTVSKKKTRHDGGPRAFVQVKLKFHYNKGIRVAVVSEGDSLSRLKQRIEGDYGFELSLQYEDSDGDKILLGSENDLAELIRNEQGTVNVHVQVSQQASEQRAWLDVGGKGAEQGGGSAGSGSPVEQE
ncbi:unnamed protein product, partial [Discosporangium mesarthrocarpum]